MDYPFLKCIGCACYGGSCDGLTPDSGLNEHDLEDFNCFVKEER
jgi:hypothetical protein